MADNVTKQDNAKTVGAGGSTFVLGNTSYSGCDIKVVLNLYDGGRGVDAEIKDLAAEMKRLEAKIRQANRNLGPAIQKLSSAKAGSAEIIYYQAEANTYLEFIKRQQESLVSIQNRQAELQKLQGKTSTKVLAEVQTLSATTARDKRAVRACGTVYPKAFTRGPREIAGSMIFTVFNQHVLYEFLDAHATDFDALTLSAALLDQLPPVDILISFANEYGSLSRMTIYGVEFMNEGQVMSIEDLMTENTVNYVARDIDPMRSIGQKKWDENSRRLSNELGKKASDLLLEDDYQSFKKQLSPFERFKRRRDPFV